MRIIFRFFTLAVFTGMISLLTAQTPVAELSVPGHNLFVNQINAAHRYFPQFNGEGIIVSIKEYRFDSTDVDFKGRYLDAGLASAQLSIHASIIGVLVAGAGTSEPAALGVAPGARISSSDFLGLKPDLPSDYSNHHITVQTHAYGSEIDYRYSDLAQAFDRSTLDNPSLIHVFSAGNKGGETPADGPYAGISQFATITGSFKMAKNVLTVGAVDSFNRVAAYSSRGPDYAGRIKPDLVAFGAGGTSEAAALVAGSAALIQQVYLARFGRLPESDLVRAILLTAATDVENPGPDYVNGYGSLNLKKALQIAAEGTIRQDSLQKEGTISYSIPVSGNVKSMKTTLAWNDPPAGINAASPLINDLDLQVIDPTGQTWQPFRLSSYPDPDSLALPAVRASDTINNIEQVFISDPVPGNYTVQIKARRLGQGNFQRFALVTDLAPAHFFEWSYPVKNDPVVPGETTLLRWHHTWPDSIKGRISWKNIDSPDWSVVDTAVLLPNLYCPWKPNGYGLAQVRMEIGASTFLSDTFLIAPRISLHVGFDCPDSTFLFWNKTAADAHYQVWGLGYRYLEPLLITSDTFLIFSKNDFPQTHFAVSPVEQGVYGARSAAPAPDKQGAGCYISVFFAELLPERGTVQTGLQLGTLYNVQSVEIQKEINGLFQSVFAANADRLNFAWEDGSPHPGINRYRAKVVLRDGRIVYSEIVPVYVGGTDGIRIFPNPFTSRGVLHVVVNNPGEQETFRLFDMAGREIFSVPLIEVHTPIQLPAIQAGVYIWRIGEVWGKLTATR